MFLFFFFSSRRRHTRFKCDWSSDVCSSDLIDIASARPASRSAARGAAARGTGAGDVDSARGGVFPVFPTRGGAILGPAERREIGRASCRGRGEISGVAGSFKKKKRIRRVRR